MSTHWYSSPAGQIQIQAFQSIGEWLCNRQGVIGDLFWLADTIRTFQTYEQQNGICLIGNPHVLKFSAPFEYEVLCFSADDEQGHSKRFWASRTKLPWPCECDFNPEKG